ncbi:MAG: TonB-dependent receptor [Sulfurovum sp.]|nr:MAG: TonB-dependent receptor [Sulfurovum sp.]
MGKGIYLSLACTLWMQAAQVELGIINVHAKAGTEVIKDVSGEDIKSADLAEALFKQSPSVSLVRRSGISNDIIVRGQKKDNINVTIDGMKIYGAGPNRMDPPISHVLTNNIDYIEINEGPYNVEDFGVLSAEVKVHTLKPEKEVHGDINVGTGSWGYKKAAFSLSGGTDTVQFLLSGSSESSEQYRDGDGNDFVGQIQREIDAGKVPAVVQYQDKYKDLDAYSKKTVMAKLFWNITDNQALKLSYTANRSDDILYPSSKMDALYDDSNLYNAEYSVKDLGRYSKELYIQLYRSDVEHPMSTKYRTMGVVNYITHKLTTQVDGAKIKNSFAWDNHTITGGIDYTLRNWDGGYYKNDIPLPEIKFHSIWDVDTKNIAFFLKDKITMDKLVLDIGLRVDDTTITSANTKQQSSDYNELNGYINGTYTMNTQTRFFAGVGKSSRVPDAKELYWFGIMGNEIGNPNLDNTVNYEFDIGVEQQFDNSMIKFKAFYSMLNDFIAYNASNTMLMMGKSVAYHAYENVDAIVYGFEFSGTYIATDSIYFDYGMAYQRGEKDTPLTGQIGTDMPEIPPFKYNLALNYDWDETFTMRAEIVGSDKWTKIDKENGEQLLDAYTILNLNATKTFANNFEITVGIDNLFDTTYAVSNTYKDLILLPTVTPNDTIVLMNEPGRYVYANVRYKF